MGKRSAANNYRRVGVAEAPPAVPFNRRWYGKLLLVLLGVGLLTLAYAPLDQFYLAWVGLVPWLVVLKNTRTQWRAFGWSWVAGTLFFIANMWWLSYVTGLGMVVLMAVLGLYWGVAGAVIRGLGLVRTADGAQAEAAAAQARGGHDPHHPAHAPRPYVMLPPVLRVLGIATVWGGLEWLRGTWPFQGLPWLYLGHTQSPLLAVCQVADVAGVAGVSFWVALVNAWVALWFLNRLGVRRLVPSLLLVLAVTAGVVGYGVWRLRQTERVTVAGPTVLVVQPNYPQSNTGEKGAHPVDILNFHADATARALVRPETGNVDLVVWSETMLPPVNREARHALRGFEIGAFRYGEFLQQSHELLTDLARKFNVALLVGGQYAADFHAPGPGRLVPRDTRNTAYYYDRAGTASDDLRYDKVHLVPFGEFIPFKESLPWLYRLLISLGPPNMEDYQLTRGDEQALTAFPLPGRGDADRPTAAATGWRFVTPICFEDIDARLCARMFRGRAADGTVAKRADVVVNITNDGWFKANEMPQHLQAAVFRSIENRAPTARSVNTGISGFIDSAGRTHGLIPAGTHGTSVATLRIDPRLTPFTRFGDWFSTACAGATGLMALVGVARWWARRRALRKGT